MFLFNGQNEVPVTTMVSQNTAEPAVAPTAMTKDNIITTRELLLLTVDTVRLDYIG